MATIEKGEGRLNRLKTAISDVQKVVSNFIESTGGDPRQGLNLIYSNVDDSKYRWVFWVFIKIKQVKNLQDFLCQIFITRLKLKVIEVLIKLIPHILLKGPQLSLLVKNLWANHQVTEATLEVKPLIMVP